MLVTSVILPTVVIIVASDTAGDGESNEVQDDVFEAMDAALDAELDASFSPFVSSCKIGFGSISKR